MLDPKEMPSGEEIPSDAALAKLGSRIAQIAFADGTTRRVEYFGMTVATDFFRFVLADRGILICMKDYVVTVDIEPPGEAKDGGSLN